MILADTSAWIDYVRGVDAPHVELLDRALRIDRVAIGDLIIAEFLQGFREGSDLAAARRIVDSLEYFDMVGRDIAERAAASYRLLRTGGVTVRKTIDVIIATFCIQRGMALIHNDRDFDPMEARLGLRVVRILP